MFQDLKNSWRLHPANNYSIVTAKKKKELKGGGLDGTEGGTAAAAAGSTVPGTEVLGGDAASVATETPAGKQRHIIFRVSESHA